MKINAQNLHYKTLNDQIKASAAQDIEVECCIGQRYIGDGLENKNLLIHGTPGNGLGAYLNGAVITVDGNVQDAVGDTMNDGAIYIHGSSGDATGYAMRGGKIFVRDNAGYRAGIHMKAYMEKLPVLVIGGQAGSFLGEYQAGGLIIVLGLGSEKQPPVGYFCGTGMHGGKMFLRCNALPHDLPAQVSARAANQADMEQIRPYIAEYAQAFGRDETAILAHPFFVLEPNTQNPYKQMYVEN